MQNCRSGHLTGDAASLLFHRGSAHDRAAGRGRHCSCGAVRQFYPYFLRDVGRSRHGCRYSDRAVSGRRGAHRGVAQLGCEPCLRGCAGSTVSAGGRRLPGAGLRALYGRYRHPPRGSGLLPHCGVLLSAHGGQHRSVRMAALQGTRRCPLLGKPWRGSGEHRAELSAHLRKAGCPRYGRYRCRHRHTGFPAFEPAFDLDRLCGLPSKGSGTPAHRGDLDTVGGRFMFIFRVQRRA